MTAPQFEEPKPPDRMRQLLVTGIVLILLAGVVIGIVGPQIMMQLEKNKLAEGAQATKIGLIDVQKVFQGSTQGKTQMQSFQQELAKRNGELKGLENEVRTMQTRIETLAKRGDTATAQGLVPRFQAAQKQYVDLQQKATAELQKTQTETDQAFMTQMKTIVDALRREEKLDLIQAIDPAKTLSYDSGLDLTQKALKKFNETYSSASGDFGSTRKKKQ